jgi:hypothetical protein
MRAMPRHSLAAFWLAVLVAAASCSPPINLAESSRIEDVVTGWYDAGITDDGKNKLVPSISFRLTNSGTRPLSSVQFNCIFRRIGDSDEWSTVLVRGLSDTELAPGETSEPFVVRAPQGYTGTQPRAQLLQNRLFVDAKVEIFGKQGSAVWASLGDFQIERQLLAK